MSQIPETGLRPSATIKLRANHREPIGMSQIPETGLRLVKQASLLDLIHQPIGMSQIPETGLRLSLRRAFASTSPIGMSQIPETGLRHAALAHDASGYGGHRNEPDTGNGIETRTRRP